MKKIVGILGMAAMLASAAFAADPAANFVCSKFDGSAEFGWKADFVKPDAVKMGMFNKVDATMEFGFITAGDKITSQKDGIWGELKIASDKKAYAPTSTATTVKMYKVNDKGQMLDKDGKVTTDPKKAVVVEKADLAPLTLPAVSVKTAKIHFVDGDFSAALNILAPSLKYDGYTPFVAVPGAAGVAAIDGTSGLTNGFAVELAMKDMFAFNFKFMDNGVVVANNNGKKFGMAFDASLKAVKNLDARVAASFNFDTEYAGFLADAAYKFPLESLSDKTYLKAGVGYSLAHVKGTDKKFTDTDSLALGVMFGWGAEGQKPELDFIAPTSDKFNEGVSVAFKTNLDDAKIDADNRNFVGSSMTIAASLYDQSLFKFLGIEDFGTLKTGVTYDVTIGNEDDVKNKLKTDTIGHNFAVATKYTGKVSILDFALHAGMKTGFGSTSIKNGDTTTTKTTDAKPAFAYGVNVGTKEIIDNTNIYVSYEGAYDSALPKDNVTKSELTIGTKISF